MTYQYLVPLRDMGGTKGPDAEVLLAALDISTPPEDFLFSIAMAFQKAFDTVDPEVVTAIFAELGLRERDPWPTHGCSKRDGPRSLGRSGTSLFSAHAVFRKAIRCRRVGLQHFSRCRLCGPPARRS